jgi:hypothetical protein
MENRRSVYESYWTEVGMVPAFHPEAVSHGLNVQATNSRAGTVKMLNTTPATGYLYLYPLVAGRNPTNILSAHLISLCLCHLT